MITKLVLAVLLTSSSIAAAQDKLSDRLHKAVVEEEVNQKFDKAIEMYTKILAQYDEDKKAAGIALFHLAECSRKLGQTEKAVAAYQRIVREFSDQPDLVKASRNNLEHGYGIRTGTDQLQDKLKMEFLEAENKEKELQLQLEIAKNGLEETRKKIESGLAHPNDLQIFQLEVEKVKFRLSEASFRKNLIAKEINQANQIRK